MQQMGGAYPGPHVHQARLLFVLLQMIVDGEKKSCPVHDATDVLKQSCASLSSESEACTISKDKLPSVLELCPSCDALSLAVYYSCRMSETQN